MLFRSVVIYWCPEDFFLPGRPNKYKQQGRDMMKYFFGLICLLIFLVALCYSNLSILTPQAEQKVNAVVEKLEKKVDFGNVADGIVGLIQKAKNILANDVFTAENHQRYKRFVTNIECSLNLLFGNEKLILTGVVSDVERTHLTHRTHYGQRFRGSDVTFFKLVQANGQVFYGGLKSHEPKLSNGMKVSIETFNGHLVSSATQIVVSVNGKLIKNQQEEIDYKKVVRLVIL